MSAFYYEQIACEMFGISPDDLNVKSRKLEVVIARWFCMLYRNKHLNMTESAAAERYDRDHATVIYAAKKIKEYEETKDVRFLQWQDFLSKCRIRLNSFTELHDVLVDPEETIDRQIEQKGFKGFITDAAYSFNRLVSLIINDDSEDEIKTQLEICHRKIHELKYLYE